MAQHNITEIVAEILALGGTEAQVLAAGRVDKDSDGWFAGNVASRNGVVMLCNELRASAAKKRAASETFSKITEGLVLYTRSASGQWLIWGRADLIISGAIVTVTKRDGSTKKVRVTVTGSTRTRGDIAYRVAEFCDIPAEHRPQLSDSPADEARRIGRRYGVDGQIWDNA